MPSPVGHLLAGVATAWTLEPRASRRLIVAAAALAAAPDLDLLTPFPHRTATHSLIAVAVVTIIAAAVTRQVTHRTNWRITAICGLAWASHLLLDWLQTDPSPPYGFQALWPFASQFFMSGWGVFRPTARTNIFSTAMIVRNVTAIAQELAILGPVVWLVYLVRVKPAARLSAEVSGRNHPAQ